MATGRVQIWATQFNPTEIYATPNPTQTMTGTGGVVFTQKHAKYITRLGESSAPKTQIRPQSDSSQNLKTHTHSEPTDRLPNPPVIGVGQVRLGRPTHCP